MKYIAIAVALLFLCACAQPSSSQKTDNTPATAPPQTQPSKTTNYSVPEVRFLARHASFSDFFGQAPQVETIAEGLLWAEGPLWIDQNGGYLLFTDVPGNRLYKWTRKSGVEIFQDPSGVPSNPDLFREPGANGLALDRSEHSILVANHGQRAVTRLNLHTRDTQIVIDRFEGKRFNSPNDLVLTKEGVLYFTDPPYGLKGLDASPYKELPHNGVYRLSAEGILTLISTQLKRPNGIALSPDEQTLYIANSDPDYPVIKAFPVTQTGIDETNATLLHDGSADVRNERLGLPDGMVIDRNGNIFSTAPGGVHVFSPDGVLLGIIDTGSANANCTIGEDGKALYIAAHTRIIRIGLNAT